jgi:hypothetical protein
VLFKGLDDPGLSLSLSTKFVTMVLCDHKRAINSSNQGAIQRYICYRFVRKSTQTLQGHLDRVGTPVCKCLDQKLTTCRLESEFHNATRLIKRYGARTLLLQ